MTQKASNMTDPDLTAPESVEKSIGMCRLHGLHGTEATLRALSSALEAERVANGHEKRMRLEVIAMEKAATARAEAVDAKLKVAVTIVEMFLDLSTVEEGKAYRKARAFLASLEGDKG